MYLYMSRAVFIGGLNNGKRNINVVAEAIGETCDYGTVDRFTFAQAMENPDEIARATRGVDTFTHSAGMLALVNTRPASIEAFNPPVPRSIGHLVGKTAVKMARMHTPGIGFSNLRDTGNVALYDLSTTAELMANVGGNLKYLPAISRFSAITAALAAVDNYTKVRIHTTNGDEYFTITPIQRTALERRHIWVTEQPGIHDELVLRPTVTLHRALDLL